MTNLQQLSTTLNSVDIKSKFEELLKGRSQQYITSILSAVSNNKLLETASWQSIYQASITAATLDLPINQNLGFAYLVPYKFKQKTTDDQGRDKWTDVCSAQFQLGYKGFIQLAQRSGQFLTINVTEVKEGEIKNYDRLTGFIDFDWKKEGRESLESIGYVGYFELINGFKKLFYMSKDELGDHGEKYSQSYNSSKMNYKTKKEEYTGLWRTNFDSMAKKTVLKLLLSKYAPLSTQMELALTSDQAVIKEDGVDYVDNDKNNSKIVDIDPTDELLDYINNQVLTKEALLSVLPQLKTEAQKEAYQKKMSEFESVSVAQTAPTQISDLQTADITIEPTAPTALDSNRVKFAKLAQESYPKSDDYQSYIQILSDMYNIESIDELTQDQITDQTEALIATKITQ